jgi:small conductance mechanosensitive channel
VFLSLNIHMPTADELAKMMRPDHWVGALIYLAVILLVAALVAHGFRSIVRRGLSTHTHHIDRTSVVFLSQLASAAIWIFAFILYSRLIPELRTLGTTLLAGASIASVVIGLAAQSTLGNLIAGIAMLIYRPFRLGDTLQVAAPAGPETGTVENISLGYTILRTADGRMVVLPNSVAASQVTINLTASPTRRVVTVTIRVTRHTDLQHAIDVAVQCGVRVAGKERVIGCFLTKLEGDVAQLDLRVRTPEDKSSESVRSKLITELAQAFDEMHLDPNENLLSFA